MKNLIKIFFNSLIIAAAFLINGCDPFDELYLTLAMDTEFDTGSPVPNVSLEETICLSDFEDYNDNNDQIEEIRFISAAYLTLAPSNGLKGDLKLKLYRQDTNVLLFDYTYRSFNADSLANKPLQINLTTAEINSINTYLINPQVDKCFKAILEVSNATDNDGAPFQLRGKVELLTELKIKP